MHHNPFPWWWHPLAYCVPPCFGHAYCVSFNNKTTIFWQFHLHEKGDKMTVCCVYNHSRKRQIWCFCLQDFLVFRYPQINVYFNKCWNDLKRRERSERAKILEFLFYIVCDVCCGSLWKLNFFIHHSNL